MKTKNRFSAICAVCGSAATIDSLCDEHYSGQRSLFSVKEFDVQICDGCASIFDQKWMREPIESVLQRAIERNTKSHSKLSKIHTEFRKEGKNYIAVITASGTFPPAKIPKTEEKRAMIRVRLLKCPACVKLLGKYHEAVIQIRGDRAERLAELADDLASKMPMTAERLKYGWNLYFVHKSNANTAVNEIERILKRVQETALEITYSHKVVGKKDGKTLMRDFYAIR